jgi:hypothetical protein
MNTEFDIKALLLFIDVNVGLHVQIRTISFQKAKLAGLNSTIRKGGFWQDSQSKERFTAFERTKTSVSMIFSHFWKI